MTDMMEKKWHSFSKMQQKLVLKDIFFNALFHHQLLPAFMTEQDWSDLFGQAVVSHIPSMSGVTSYEMVLYLDIFDFRYSDDEFDSLVDFLEGPIAHVKVHNLNLLESCTMENNIIWFNFNMPTVFFYLSQQ